MLGHSALARGQALWARGFALGPYDTARACALAVDDTGVVVVRWEGITELDLAGRHVWSAPSAWAVGPNSPLCIGAIDSVVLQHDAVIVAASCQGDRVGGCMQPWSFAYGRPSTRIAAYSRAKP